MAANTRGRKVRAVGAEAAQGRPTDIGKMCGEGFREGRRRTRASTRQTKGNAKEAPNRFDGTCSTFNVKQTSNHSKQGRATIVKSVRNAMKADEDEREMSGRVEKSRARRMFTRSELPVTRRNGLIAGPESGEGLEIKKNGMPSAEEGNWTKDQERTLQESISTVKPGVNFWRLVAERVPGKNAEDCFGKFYFERTTTRAAKRLCTLEEPDSALTERNGSKRVKSVPRNAHIEVKTPGRETRPTGGARPAKIETKTCDEEYNAGALIPQTVATRIKGTKRRIEAASNLPEVKRIKATIPESEVKDETLTQRVRKGGKNRTAKQVSIEKARVRALAPAVALASGFNRSIHAYDGDESDSAFGVAADDNLWTKGQELALQNAYATIKPSADFWHLISKRVPGRSAEECFDKFYSAHPTPPRAPQRSCLKEVNCPPSLPRTTKAKATGSKRLLEAHRTVRNLLRRQQVDDEDYKADAFAALEPPDVVHSVMHSVSAMSYETDLNFCVCPTLPGSTENSTTQCTQSNKENRKPKGAGQSREFGIGQSQVFSPEILKKVKDPLMLDKYIDHLHHRRTRRTGTKSALKKESAQRPGGVYELSKDALDCREVRSDAIHRAKQELRDVFLRPSSAVDDPFWNLLDESSAGSEEDD